MSSLKFRELEPDGANGEDKEDILRYAAIRGISHRRASSISGRERL